MFIRYISTVINFTPNNYIYGSGYEQETITIDISGVRYIALIYNIGHLDEIEIRNMTLKQGGFMV